MGIMESMLRRTFSGRMQSSRGTDIRTEVSYTFEWNAVVQGETIEETFFGGIKLCLDSERLPIRTDLICLTNKRVIIKTAVRPYNIELYESEESFLYQDLEDVVVKERSWWLSVVLAVVGLAMVVMGETVVLDDDPLRAVMGCLFVFLGFLAMLYFLPKTVIETQVYLTFGRQEDVKTWWNIRDWVKRKKGRSTRRAVYLTKSDALDLEKKLKKHDSTLATVQSVIMEEAFEEDLSEIERTYFEPMSAEKSRPIYIDDHTKDR